MIGIHSHLAAAAVGAMLAAGIVATGMGWRADARVNEIKAQHAEAVVVAVEVAREEERKIAAAEASHAKKTQENSDAFTQSQPARDAAARADLAISERLRRDAERRAATYRAMSEAGAAACRDLAGRHEAIDRHVVEGVAVVGELREAVGRRDAEIVLLRGQIDADRALFAQR